MNDENASNPSPTQDIILDSCILQYIGNKQILGELLAYLLELVERGFGLTISEVSYFELLSGTTIKQEKSAVDLLDKFNRYLIDLRVLIAASQLSTLYFHQCKLEDRSPQNISFQDKIIAATAILTGSLILTANINDFPRPFFQEAEEKPIFYKHKNKTQMLVLQLLRPNQLVVQQRFHERPQG